MSALLFGAGHLPAASVLIGRLTTDIMLFVVGANAVFGGIFGYLFWRRGLEAAMIAHGTAHAVNYIAGRLVSRVLKSPAELEVFVGTAERQQSHGP